MHTPDLLMCITRNGGVSPGNREWNKSLCCSSSCKYLQISSERGNGNTFYSWLMIFWSKTAEMPVEGVDVTQLLTHQAGVGLVLSIQSMIPIN